MTPDPAEPSADLFASARQVSAAAADAILLLTGKLPSRPLTAARSGGAPRGDRRAARPATRSLPLGLTSYLEGPVVRLATASRTRPLRGVAAALGLHGGLAVLVLGAGLLHTPPPPPAPVEISIALTTTQPAGVVAPSAAPLPDPPAIQPPPPLAPDTAMLPVAYTIRKPAAPELSHPPAPALTPGAPVPPHLATAINTATIPAHPDLASNNPPPDYPVVSRQLGEQGEVLLNISVLPSGAPAAVSIIRSSGYPTLDNAARNAVLRWHFAPALKAGTPIAWSLFYRISFQLQ